MSKPTKKGVLHQAVVEYLLMNGWNETVDLLNQEYPKAKKANAKKNYDHGSVKAAMMSAFNSGNYEEFFRLWNRFIPIGIRENDREAVKLDFYIHIYFTIFNLHPMTKKSSVGVQKEFKKRKEWFRLYLDTKGKDLSETSEFLAYYALPYIGNPIDHPSFKSMFSGKWLKQIVAHTESFVSDNIMKDPKSKLQSYHAAYKKVMKEEGEESIEAAVEIDQLSEQLINERRKFLETNAHLKKVRNILLASQTKWSGFSQNLLKIAEDFYFIMEKFKVTDQVDQKWLMEKVTKLSKYKNYLMALQNEKDANTSRMDPSRVNSAVYQPRPPETAHDESIDPTAPGGNASFTDSKSGSYVTYYQNQDNLYQLKYDPSQDDRIAHGYYEGQPVEMNPDDEDQISLAPLDYNKIKMFIFHLQEEVKVWITLQALKQRISRSRNGNQRKHVLFAFEEYDILGCKSQEDQNLLSLLESSPSIKLYTVLLIDSLVNESIGKKYISKQDGLIEKLFEIMQNEEGETPLRTSTLVVFQKLSLGREAQSKMINLDVIKWTVDKLKVEGQILNSYSLEYAFALLMNLSLRTQGKRKFEELHSDALNVLNEFLEHENSEVRTYVNGTLYCILERPKIREEARSLNMDEVLRILSKKFEPRFKRQIDYILDQLEGDKEGEGEGEADIKDDNSSDALDGNSEEGEFADVESIDSEGDDYSNYEDEEDDFSKIPLQGEEAEMFPRGEKWLMQEFLLDDNEEANKQDMILYSKVEEYNEERRRRREIMEKKRMEESMTSSRDQDAHLDKPHMRPLTPSKVPSQKYKDKASVFEPDSSSRNMASDISRSRYEMQRTPPDRDVRVREALSPLSRNQHSVSSPAKSMKASAPMEASFERKEEEKEEKEEHGIYIDHNEDKQIIPKEENLQDQNQNKKENDEKLKDPEKQAEHQEAFTGKDKIRRTPPKESKLRYLREKKKKMQQKPHLYK